MRKIPDGVFKALSDPTRRELFERLARDGEHSVHALTRHAGVSQPAVSKHLAVLRLAGLVQDRREGRETHYRAAADSLVSLRQWLEVHEAFWRDRFGRLENLLNEL